MWEHRDHILINSQEATPMLGDQEHLQGWWLAMPVGLARISKTIQHQQLTSQRWGEGVSMCDYSPIWAASTWRGCDHLLEVRYWVWVHIPNFLKLSIPRERSNLNRHHLDPQASSSMASLSLSPGPFFSWEFLSFVLITLNIVWSHFAPVCPWL